MAYWLCFTPHIRCSGQCAVCLDRNRPVEVHVVQADERPLCALNGPVEADDINMAGRQLLGQINIYFEIGQDGRLKLK